MRGAKKSRELALEFHAFGHPNVRATHRTTLEVTKDRELGRAGDCILAVSSEVSAADIPSEFADAIRSGWRVKLVISCCGFQDEVSGWGSKGLTLDGRRGLIARKSQFLSPDTFAIRCDKSAGDIRRDLVQALKGGGPVSLKIVVREPE